MAASSVPIELDALTADDRALIADALYAPPADKYTVNRYTIRRPHIDPAIPEPTVAGILEVLRADQAARIAQDAERAAAEEAKRAKDRGVHCRKINRAIERFWASRAGTDPVEFFRALGLRIADLRAVPGTN